MSNHHLMLKITFISHHFLGTYLVYHFSIIIVQEFDKKGGKVKCQRRSSKTLIFVIKREFLFELCMLKMINIFLLFSYQKGNLNYLNFISLLGKSVNYALCPIEICIEYRTEKLWYSALVLFTSRRQRFSKWNLTEEYKE